MPDTLSSYTEPLGDFYVAGKRVIKTELFDHNLHFKGVSFYEVMKVRNGVPLFAEDHIERLLRSAKGKCVGGVPAHRIIRENITLLIGANPVVTEGNIRVLLHCEDDLSSGPVIYSYYIPHKYPSERDYMNGVSLVTVNAERTDVHCKIINTEFREKLAVKIRENNAWEALLVNAKGNVTEGSKSNFFGISGDNVVTPPEKDVLQGITRKNVIEICRQQNIKVWQKSISTTELPGLSSCFITGTSPGVLAVKSIDGMAYLPGHPLLRELSERYNKTVSDYIRKNKFTT